MKSIKKSEKTHLNLNSSKFDSEHSAMSQMFTINPDHTHTQLASTSENVPKLIYKCPEKFQRETERGKTRQWRYGRACIHATEKNRQICVTPKLNQNTR